MYDFTAANHVGHLQTKDYTSLEIFNQYVPTCLRISKTDEYSKDISSIVNIQQVWTMVSTPLQQSI